MIINTYNKLKFECCLLDEEIFKKVLINNITFDNIFHSGKYTGLIEWKSNYSETKKKTEDYKQS
jgi:hypothetical protein